MINISEPRGLLLPLSRWSLVRSWLCFWRAGLDMGNLQNGQQQLEGILDVCRAVAALREEKRMEEGLFS